MRGVFQGGKLTRKTTANPRVSQTVNPTGDLDGEMRQIKRYYKGYQGRRPANFTVGDIE